MHQKGVIYQKKMGGTEGDESKEKRICDEQQK